MLDQNNHTHSSLSIEEKRMPTQPCPRCEHPIGAIPGTKAAICRNCGFKDPCCE